MAESERLLPVDSIPACLWERPRALLHLPESLRIAFLAEVDRLGLRTEAAAASESGPAGGMTVAETHVHFAQRFTGSCGRVELVALDPKTHLLSASDRVISALAGGRIALLDIPCGAGAGALSLLATIATLRREACLPAHPLDVHLFGGDVSPSALEIAARLLESLRPSLEEQSITVKAVFEEWDVRDQASTIKLLSKWTSGGDDFRIYFVVAANFSAFLGSEGNFKRAKPQLEQILLWAGVKRSRLIWIEPQTTVAKAFFARMFEKLKDALRWLALWRPPAIEGPFAETDCIQQHAIDEKRQFAVRLALMLLEYAENRQ